MDLFRICDVVPLEEFRVRLTLTDGTVTERDLSALVAGPVFERVRREAAYFREVRVGGGTLVWPDGADLCPDVIIWGGPPPADPPAGPPVFRSRDSQAHGPSHPG